MRRWLRGRWAGGGRGVDPRRILREHVSMMKSQLKRSSSTWWNVSWLQTEGVREDLSIVRDGDKP